MPRRITMAVMLTCAVLAVAVLLSGCGSADPVMDSREALGTIVSVTAYPEGSTDASAVADSVDSAYTVMVLSEQALSAYLDPDWIAHRFDYGYDPDPTVATQSIHEFNQNPFIWRVLPPEAERILERLDALGVSESFSPALFEVVAAYAFDDGGVVPSDEVVSVLLQVADTFETRQAVGGTEARFESLGTAGADGESVLIPGGMDLGGAAKGYALDQAVRRLADPGDVAAALVTAGSTTIAFGDKPDGEPWRVGIEDPRDPDTVVATVEGTSDLTVSTSGDYQRYFEVDGVRYHHIIDPATGYPASGLRSLTVIGAESALDSDILSTALFVMGANEATAYAEENGLGLVIVDDEGLVQVVPGPEERGWEIIVEDVE